MPDFINQLVLSNYDVKVFESDAYWADIGHMEELERAQRDWPENDV
jgi:NDP-sugar pyrophosphorylase family protein